MNRSNERNTPASAATVHRIMKWKKPTRSVMPRHEASTASRPRPKVSARTVMVRPSSARKKSMPSGAIQGTLTCASQAPSTRPAAPGPRAANAARRVPALASHWPTSRASGAATARFAAQPVPRAIQAFWLHGWGFDWLYERVFVRPVKWFARIARGDLVEPAVGGIAWLNLRAWRALSASQNGLLRTYLTVAGVGIVLV